MKSFLDLVISGGPLMIPITLCSVIALGVFLERLFYLRRKKIIPAATIPGPTPERRAVAATQAPA